MEGAKPPPRSAIEPLHRARQALADRDLDRLRRARERRVSGFPLIGGEGRQDVLVEIGDLGGWIGRRHTDAQTRKVLADGRHDRAHAVVGTRTAALAQADLAEWKVDLIEDHEECGWVDAIAIEQLADRAAGVVHEGLRTSDRDPHAIDRAFGDARIGRFQSELRARALRKPRCHLKARVRTRRRVTLAGVAEPHDDAVHARRRGSTSTEQLRESRHRASKTPKRPVHSDGATDAYFRSTIASASARVERSVIGSTTRIASSAPAASSARRCEASFSTLTGAASCRRAPPGDEAADYLERLLEPRSQLVVGDPERPKLRLVPARAEAAPEPPAAPFVDRGGHAGQDSRGVERRRGNERAELDSRRDHRQRGELGPDIPGSAVGALVAAVEQMVAHPDRVEARVLRGTRDRDDLRPAHLALDLG